MFEDLNWLAIIVSTVAAMIIGAGWYGAFAGPWAREAGVNMNDKSGAGMGYAISTLTALVTAIFMAKVVGYLGADTLLTGLMAGIGVWLGFVATTTLMNTAWEKRSWTLWLINNGNHLVTYAVMGVILALWQ